MSVSFGRETQRNKWDDMEVVLTMVPVAHPGIGGAPLVAGHAGSAMPVVPLAVHRAASRVRPAQVSNAIQFLDTPPIHLGIRLRRFSNSGTLSAFGAIRAVIGGTGLSPRTLRQRKIAVGLSNNGTRLDICAARPPKKSIGMSNEYGQCV